MNRKQLANDLEFVNWKIRSIEQSNDLNFIVAVQNYLKPFIFSTPPVPMNHSLGLVTYYRRIQEALKLALNPGYFPRSKLPKGSPRYLEELAV